MSDCAHDWYKTPDFLTIGWTMVQRMFPFRICRTCKTAEHFLGNQWRKGGPYCYSLEQPSHRLYKTEEDWVEARLKFDKKEDAQ